jgi:hypothetical protein
MLCSQDLASGYMSGKLLLKLDAINFILGHHTHEHFPFLDPPRFAPHALHNALRSPRER